MKIQDNFGFYGILTDPVRGYDYCTKLFVDYEVAFVQLRMKDAPDDLVIKTARTMREITRGTKTKLIINDNPAIAKAVDADGAHVGQTDMPGDDARVLLGDEAIIGISTQSVQQMQGACRLRPDYVGIGPVYPTATKKDAEPAIGIDGMKEVLAHATVPAVAIGGITVENLPLVFAAGARNFCMVSPITMTNDPEKALKEIVRVYRSVV